MDHANTAQRVAMDSPDLRAMIFRQIPASLAGLETCKMFGSVDKKGALIQKEQAKTERWTRYDNAQLFVKEVEAYDWPFSSDDWARFMTGLATHCCDENSTARLLNIATHEKGSVGPVNYKEACREMRRASAVAHMRIVTQVMELYPRNLVIRNVGLGLLARLHKKPKILTEADTELYEPHAALAFEMLLHKKRDADSVKAAMGMIVSINNSRREVVREYVARTGCDIMLVVFDVQDEFCGNDGVMCMCNKISQVFLPIWQVPPSLADTETRLPMDVIMDTMRQHSGSSVHLQLGSQQLHDLSLMNFNTVKISHPNMVFVSKMINDVNMKLPRPTETERVYNLWTFLHLCVRTPASLRSFQHVFRVDFLMRSLMSFVADPDNMVRSDAGSLTRCLVHICNFIQHFVNDADNMHPFLEADGISTLMTTIVNQCHGSNSQHDASPRAICISILLQVFVEIPEIMMSYLLMSSRSGQLVPIKFSYGVYFRNAGHNQTLHDFLWTSLGGMLGKDVQIAADAQHMRMVENTVVFLFEISKYWDLVRDDIAKSMPAVLAAAKQCVLVYGHRIPTVHTSHIDLRLCVAFLQQVVRVMDSILLNYAHGMTVHDMPLSEHSRLVGEYLALTGPYRDCDNNALALVFSPRTLDAGVDAP